MALASASEEELTALVLGTKDPSAFAELVRRYQSLVRNLLLRMTGDPANVDDIAQDAFLHAFERLDQFNGTGTFRAWLCRIAYTKMLMLMRSRKSAARMNTALEQSERVTNEVASEDTGLSLDMNRALSRLDDAERVAVVLNYVGGFSHAELSQVLHLPLGTVKSHILRGRAKLKTYLTPRENNDEQ